MYQIDLINWISDLILKYETDALKAQEELENLDWYEEIFYGLSDKEIEGAIRGCNSQAYYQEFIVE